MGNCLTCAAQDCQFADLDELDAINMDGKDLPYEFHYTIDTDNGFDFLQWCRENGIKGIIIDDMLKNGNVRTSVMTSSVMKGSWVTAKKFHYDIASKLATGGWNAKRVKIETVPWQSENLFWDGNQTWYREAHFELGPFSESQYDLLKQDTKLHLSSRKDKPTEGCLATYRQKLRWEQFNEDVMRLKKGLILLNFQVKKVISELTMFDSNESYDDVWIKN